MEMIEFKEKIYEELEKKEHMVLGTASDNRVTARSVSTIFQHDKLYFQTDVELFKYVQITQNANVALCDLNIQVQGTARVLGYPLEAQNREFVNAFSKKHKDSFEKYGYLPNEVVIEVTPKFIETWSYENGRPYLYTLDLESGNFKKREYPINHTMKLKEDPFEKIKNGTKIFEYRLNDEKRQFVRIGDTILFSKLPLADESLLTEVVDIQHFPTFFEAFKELHCQDNTDIGDDIEKAAISMRQFYSQAEEAKYGTLAIKIKVLKKLTN